MNIRASLSIALPSFLLLLGGCIIVDGNTNSSTGGAGGEGNTTASSTSSSSSSTGSSAGGAGGQGGSAGAGVGGGGPMCADSNDGILDVLSCDKLNTKGVTCNGVDALANGTCSHGFDIFQGGAFDVLVKCLQGIEGDMANACDDSQVEKCVGVMYTAACPSQAAAATCDAIRANLCAAGEPFDTQGCLLDTNPLNTKALQEVADCITNTMPPTTCQADYNACFGKIISF